MHISEWIPPGMDKDGQANVNDGDAGQPLIALAIVAAVVTAGVLACDYLQAEGACAAQAAAVSC